ncbi:cupredoxin domain-containing protein [Streptomyces sp. NPDC127084]|uniref:cupredoxin domain-containing protein n=1 Tax=Streptomyces sp. NPDC127084 TaxID=3347133 RepID=UPI003664950E
MSTEQVSSSLQGGRQTIERVRGIVATVLTASLLAACGSGESEQVNVEATDTACTVSPKEVSSGTHVTFTVKNTGTKSVDFALLAPDGDAVLREQGISPGGSEEVEGNEVNDDGTYTVECAHNGESPIRTEFSIR